jgi:hypothetical protein
VAAGAALSWRRRHDRLPTAVPSPGEALALEPPEDTLVVFVPGHGNGPEVFDDLIDEMGLRDDQVRFFDYRLATEDVDVVDGSERASVEEAADALNGYLAGLSSLGRPMYVVGYSKGGAVAAELLGRWDDGAAGPADAVGGVALLDPPLATGPHGWLQSLGRAVDVIPDDGGYDPVSCTFLSFGCDDQRDFLGWGAGIDPAVIRNPKSGITSFGDSPRGLRIYDAPDAGPAVGSLWWKPWEMPGRMAEAHRAVLEDAAVADCLVAEMHEPGACSLEPASPAASPGARRALEAVRRFLDGFRGL